MATGAPEKATHPLKRENLPLFLEHLDSFLVSVLKYVVSAIVLFSLGIAIYSFFSGSFWADFSVTQAGANILYSIAALALIIFWRELREIRIWLEGISERHAKHTYPRLSANETIAKKKRGA